VVRGGEASNVIPRSVYIEGTLRSMDPVVRERLVAEVERCFSLARAFGGDYTLKFERGYPPMHNHAGVADLIERTARDVLGDQGIGSPTPTMGAEDFSYMAQAAPGCFLRLGVHNPAWQEYYPVHRADFRLDEDALPIGAAALALTALRWMENKR